MSSQFTLLTQRRFAPFFWTQFFGAFNDNVLKNALVVLVTYQAARYTGGGVLAGVNSGVLVNAAAALFILPFFLFSATAGQLSDRLEKASLIRAIKGIEIGVMGLALWGFAVDSVWALLGALFLMGLHSTFFGPVKYSILPQNLREEELVGGNALVEAGTFVAVLGGTIAGGYLAAMTDVGPLYAGLAGLAVAVAGFAMSWLIPRSPAADPGLKVAWNPVTETIALFRFVRPNPAVYRSILGISWFWLYGALLLSQFPAYAKEVLQGGESSVTVLLATFSIGIGLGSLLCERLSGHKVEIGLVPFGSIGITLFGVDFFFASRALDGVAFPGIAALTASPAHLRVLGDLLMMGVFGGFYIVPLYALVQTRSERSHVSRVVAANNVLNALFMVSGAIVAIVLLSLGFSVIEILLAAAVMNAVVAVYIYTLVPEFLMRFMVWILIHSVYRLRKSGLENIPDDGAAIIVCNHVSFVDALVVSAACRRPIRWVMDHRIFRTPLLSFFFRTVRAIPIAPAREDAAALESAYGEIEQALRDGDLIGLFPEGRLTPDGEVGPFRNGITKILDRVPVPVVPMALQGLWKSVFARNGERIRSMIGLFPTVGLRVGEPLSPAAASPAGLREIVIGLRGAHR